jgi:hypothetical protein
MEDMKGEAPTETPAAAAASPPPNATDPNCGPPLPPAPPAAPDAAAPPAPPALRSAL